VLELLESRRLLTSSLNAAQFSLRAEGGNPLGVATGAGADRNVWFTLSSNSIGMINPSNPSAGVTQYPIPTANSAPGPIAAGPQAILYASDIDKGQIYKVDKTTGTLLQTIPVSAGLDSLIFDNNDNIIYSAWSVGGVGEVRRVDPNVGISSDTYLATIGNGGHDLALVPGGNFVLATSANTGRIYEVNLNNPGQTPTTFGSGQYTDGIVYDNQGRLFAVYNRSTVVELDPQTFKVMKTTGPLQGLDGLAFDSYTGNLFVSSRAVNSGSGRYGIYEVSLQSGSFLQTTLMTSSAFPTTFFPDGLESDGQGNVYLASGPQGSGDDKIYRYDIISGKLTALTSPLYGLDDLLPLSGVGAHSPSDYWFFEETADQFGVIDPTTGHIKEVPLLTTANPQVDGIAPGPNGTVWFTEFNADQIGVINTNTNQITEFPLPTASAEPYGIVEGPDGNMWFTEAGANQIGMINPTTDVIQEFPIDSSGNGEPEGIAVGPDNNLWFTLTRTDKIGVMNPTNGTMVAEYGGLTANAAPDSITLGPGQASMWFTEPGVDQIAVISTTGTVTEYPASGSNSVPTAITAVPGGAIWYDGADQPGIDSFASGKSTSYSYTNTQVDGATGITAGPNGNLWFTQKTDNQVGVFNPATNISAQFALPAGSSGPIGIAFGPDNNLWFTEAGSNQIGTINPSSDKISQNAVPTANAGLDQIVSDPADGNLWFTEETADKVGRINPVTGKVDEFAVPTAGAAPEAITVDKAGNVWFTESNASQIAELSPNDPTHIMEYPVPAAPYGIAAGADGNIWFTEYGFFSADPTTGDPAGNYDKVGVFNPPSDSVIHQYTVAGGYPGGAIILGPDQNLWFTYGASPPSAPGSVGMIMTSGAIAETTVPNATPAAIASGTDGNIWFAGTGLGSNDPNVIGLVTLSPSATPTQLAVTTQPPSTLMPGQGFGLVVSVENSAGNADPDYTGTVSIALANNPGTGSLDGTLTEPVFNGVAVFSGLGLKIAGGGYTIQATGTGLSSATSTPIRVNAGFATQLVITSTNEPPSTVPADLEFGFVVDAVDRFGNIDPTFGNAVTIALVDSSGGTLDGSSSAVARSGVATFSGLSIDMQGAYTIQATGSGLIAGTTNSITVTPEQTTTAAASTSTAFSPDDQNVQLSATVSSGSGPINAGTETFTILSGTTVIGSAVTVNVGNGMASASYDLPGGTLTGNYIIQAVYNGTTDLPGSTDTRHTLTVNPLPAYQVVFGQQPTDGVAGVAINPAVTVKIEDQYNNLVTTDGSTVTLTLSGGTFEGGSSTITAVASGGVAIFSDVTIDVAQPFTLSASDTGLAPSGPSNSFTIAPAPASQLVISGYPTQTTAGAANSFTLTVLDPYDNVATGYVGTVQFTSSDQQSTAGTGLPNAYTFTTGDNGIHIFSAALKTKGFQSITAQDMLISTINGTQPLIYVTPARATHLVLLAQPPATIIPGRPFAIRVAAEDPFGNIDPSFNKRVTVALATNPGRASLGGTRVVTAKSGIATFSGLSLNSSGNGYKVKATSSDLIPATTTPFNVNAAPIITSESVATTPALSFSFQYSVAMNAATAGLAANYQVEAFSTKTVNKKTVKVATMVHIKVAYNQSKHLVTLTVIGKNPFSTGGGQIRILASSAKTGVSSKAGVLLSAKDTIFAISPNGSSIKLS
jgi:streptogramin lyase